MKKNTQLIRFWLRSLKDYSCLIFFGSVFLFLPASALGHSKELPIAGKDQIQPQILENHSEALLRWAKKDIKDAILINIDAHDDMRWVKPEKIVALERIKKEKDWQALEAADSINEKGLYHIGSFIHVANKLGIISQVYWVVPFPYLKGPAPTQTMNSFLRDYGFSQEDIDTFVMENGNYKGKCNGVPLVISDIESLPEIKQPVVLTLDADFFPSFSSLYEQDMLTSIGRFFRSLKEKEYLILDLTIASSINGGYLDISRRWIVQACEELFSQPEKINGPYPEKWLVYNLADTYYYQNQPQVLLDFVGRFEKKYKQDISLMVYKSFALLAEDKEKVAFEIGKKLSLLDRNYTYLLADLGQCLIDQGKLDVALKYFQKAYKINPQMNFRQKNLAEALMRAGRYKQAFYYYDIYQEKNGLFPVAFAMGLAKLRIGQDTQAGVWFERGLDSLKKEKYVLVDSQIDIEAIREAANYFRKQKGDVRAVLITSHSGLKDFFPGEDEKNKEKCNNVVE